MTPLMQQGKEYRVEDLGVIAYKDAWEIQQGTFEKLVKLKQGTLDLAVEEPIPTIYICEHPHVYTLGKSGDCNNLLMNKDFLAQKEATYVETNRGGDITYHGPGQLVVYPVIDLDRVGLSLRTYIYQLEEAVISFIKDEYAIHSDRIEGATGVWLKPEGDRPERKICAIGVKSSRHITMHGLAFNINTNLDYFSYINPCGFVDKGVTSLEKELGEKQDFTVVKERFLKYLTKALSLS